MNCVYGFKSDRLLAALLLAILGYDHSQIMKDYLQTNERPPNSSLPHNYDISNVPKEIWSAIQQARPEFLQRALDTISRNYGTVENYVTEGTGISEEQLSSFRNFMLSPESSM
ncbi:tyrosine-protein phosphatase [Endozoicomonas arenosclerae]|uniref:tyrosine-protein phosphatase n=1 Tax=Endozoicomonas arenosclerae TaxID=1633495 RepID=UPI000783A2C3|nr:tyrosine-protein phosphatase [Endozoicomonas arenosclerae]